MRMAGSVAYGAALSSAHAPDPLPEVRAGVRRARRDRRPACRIRSPRASAANGSPAARRRCWRGCSIPRRSRKSTSQPYKVERAADAAAVRRRASIRTEAPSRRDRCASSPAARKEPVNTVFTIDEHPLWIGRKGCHVELDGSGAVDPPLLDLRARQRIWSCATPTRTWARSSTDNRSRGGDRRRRAPAARRLGAGQRRADGRNGRAGRADPPRRARSRSTRRSSPEITQQRRGADSADRGRVVLICVEGPLNGQEFEIPPSRSGGRPRRPRPRSRRVSLPPPLRSRPRPEGTIRVRDLGSRNGTFLNTLPAQQHESAGRRRDPRGREPIQDRTSPMNWIVVAALLAQISLPTHNETMEVVVANVDVTVVDKDGTHVSGLRPDDLRSSTTELRRRSRTSRDPGEPRDHAVRWGHRH